MPVYFAVVSECSQCGEETVMQTYQRLRVTVVGHLDHSVRMLVGMAHSNGIGNRVAVGRLGRRRGLTAQKIRRHHCWIASRKSNMCVEMMLRDDGYEDEE